ESIPDKQDEELSDDTLNCPKSGETKDLDYSELIDDADMLIKYADEIKEHLDNAQLRFLIWSTIPRIKRRLIRCLDVFIRQKVLRRSSASKTLKKFLIKWRIFSS
ncbi:MAG TPA: hypothetical protein PLI57_06945, partial [Spirochaetota bacterium]|nr:hypothetical protein [Spirochaetota bacterium]